MLKLIACITNLCPIAIDPVYWTSHPITSSQLLGLHTIRAFARCDHKAPRFLKYRVVIRVDNNIQYRMWHTV